MSKEKTKPVDLTSRKTSIAVLSVLLLSLAPTLGWWWEEKVPGIGTAVQSSIFFRGDNDKKQTTSAIIKVTKLERYYNPLVTPETILIVHVDYKNTGLKPMDHDFPSYFKISDEEGRTYDSRLLWKGFGEIEDRPQAAPSLTVSWQLGYILPIEVAKKTLFFGFISSLAPEKLQGKVQLCGPTEVRKGGWGNLGELVDTQEAVYRVKGYPSQSQRNADANKWLMGAERELKKN